MEATKRSLAVMLCAAAISVGSVAQAQNPELGDTGEGGGGWAPPAAGASASGSVSTDDGVDGSSEFSGSTSPSSSPSGDGAHADAVGKFGIGFFGTTELPICDDPNAACGGGSLTAPSIGMRYWLTDLIGLEGALGFMTTSGTFSEGTAEQYERSQTGFALHAAVPLALAYSGNFVFQVIPEMNFGLTSGTIYNNVPPGAAPNDQDISGMSFSLGGRAGAEIHFGFIGLPQLSLQGTVGLHMTFISRSGTRSTNMNEVSHTNTIIGTSVQDSPWGIFAGNITAIYYFWK